MTTEDEYRDIINRFDECQYSNQGQQAETVLRDGLRRATAAGDKAIVLLFDGWLACSRNDYEIALENLREAKELSPDSLLIADYLSRAPGSMLQALYEEQEERRDQDLKLAAWRSLSARSAHRIGNQLFAARGALRTLRNMSVPAALEAVADLERSLNRIRLILREFQTFGKAEPPHLRPTRIGPVIEQVVRRYRNMSIDTQWTIHLSRRLPFCRLDQDQFEQALGELLENAIHHTPTGGQISVAARAVRSRKPPGIRITAENTGPGVPDADKERIFEPFVSTRPGGTGLGLAIVKQIVEQQGGTVRETGRPGKGARFEIELPAVQKSEAKP